jgi:glycosyltransferase involved in cell wall biosynthesis
MQSGSRIARVALFADTFHEVNGAALTCRNFEDFARRRSLPFLSIHCGDKEGLSEQGSVTVLQLRRGRTAFPVDIDLRFDPLLQRHLAQVKRRVQAFAPDIVHITSPGDLGIMGARIAHALRVPLVIAWHTNVHEFAASRMRNMTAFLPDAWRQRLGAGVENFVLGRVAWFYGLADAILAPNQELIDLLEARTGRPAFLMPRGVDTVFLSPENRRRSDSDFVLGFVGRLQPEKNVRFLIELERMLEAAGAPPFRFLIVGSGSELVPLQQGLKHSEFTGVLSGRALAEAFADMDLFVFPSRTDTFGNVVQEAMASGVPSVVTNAGGPRFIVEHGVTGFISADDEEMAQHVLAIMNNAPMHANMRARARAYALSRSWDAVFELVYQAYEHVRAIRV